MKRFIILLVLFAAGCMTANDQATPCIDKTATSYVHDTTTILKHTTDTLRINKMDTLRIHDTLAITKRDTIRVHDTIFTTVIKHDTAQIHDTTRVIIHDTVLASLPDPANLFGVWTGSAGGKDIAVAFTSSVLHPADFSANIGTTSTSGYLSQVDSAQAKVRWGLNDVTWLIDLRAGVLTIQEIGTQMFPGGAVTLRKR